MTHAQPPLVHMCAYSHQMDAIIMAPKIIGSCIICIYPCRCIKFISNININAKWYPTRR